MLMAAIINGGIRDATYKPLLLPYIGRWAHQVSTIILISLFAVIIYYFIKRYKDVLTLKHTIIISTIWFFATLAFEVFMVLVLSNGTVTKMLSAYYIWKGETWVLVPLSLIILPVYFLEKLHKQT